MRDCCIYDRLEQCFHDCADTLCPRATRRVVRCTKCGCEIYDDEPSYKEYDVCEECYEDILYEEEEENYELF